MVWVKKLVLIAALVVAVDIKTSPVCAQHIDSGRPAQITVLTHPKEIAVARPWLRNTKNIEKSTGIV